MPGTTTSKLFVTYVLESDRDGERYIGFTTDLKRRLQNHNDGKNFSTAYRMPMRLIYAEACLNETDARRREKYLKKTGGRRFLAKRLKEYYSKL